MLSIKELRKLKAEDLDKELKKARINLTKAEIVLKTGKDRKSHMAKELKRYCAQILTIKRELASAEPQES